MPLQTVYFRPIYLPLDTNMYLVYYVYVSLFSVLIRPMAEGEC